MSKQLAKGMGLVLALVIYFGGYRLIYDEFPGLIVDGSINWRDLIIVIVLWSFATFVLSGGYKQDSADD